MAKEELRELIAQIDEDSAKRAAARARRAIDAEIERRLVNKAVTSNE